VNNIRVGWQERSSCWLQGQRNTKLIRKSETTKGRHEARKKKKTAGRGKVKRIENSHSLDVRRIEKPRKKTDQRTSKKDK